MQFTVGFRIDGKSGHLVVAGDDALVAATKVKNRHPHAFITYVRPQNRRGDARHPAQSYPSAPREAYRATRERTGGHGSVRHPAIFHVTRGCTRAHQLEAGLVARLDGPLGRVGDGLGDISHHRWAAGRPADQSSLGGHTSCAVGTAHRAAAVRDSLRGGPSEGSTSITGCGGNRAANDVSTHAKLRKRAESKGIGQFFLRWQPGSHIRPFCRAKLHALAYAC